VLLALLLAVCLGGLGRGIVAAVLTAGMFAWGGPPADVGGWLLAVGGVALVGLLGGRLTRSTARLALQAAQSERDKAQRVVLEERTRIARDLHDIVAHHMSLVVVQAETAPYRLPDLPDSARTELESISNTARSALAETRTLLTVLRGDDVSPAHAPQPGLDRLAELVETTRRAGVQLDATVDATFGELRPGTSLAAYRIAQEALANATRHAPGTPVRLVVHRDADAVHVAVENATSRPPGPSGHGITGMRERARAEGGEVTITHTDGRFAVAATLPAPR
jgi:signal transduction histidine kinase